MKLFMLWDMEGASGLFTREHTWFWEEGVRPNIAEEGRQLLIADINSATSAALDAGANEVIICDTHHGGGNITVEEMNPNPGITYLTKSRGMENGTYRWMPGLNETVDGFLVMGHHAKAGTEGSFMHHTQTLEWADVQINGLSVGEMGIEACFAGHWDVPVIMAQGDEHACCEAEAQFPGAVTAAVKRAKSYNLAEGLDAEAGRTLTSEKIAEAIENTRAGTVRPFKATLPMTVTIEMKKPEQADKAVEKRPSIERVDDLTVRGVVDGQCDVLAWFSGDGLNISPRA